MIPVIYLLTSQQQKVYTVGVCEYRTVYTSNPATSNTPWKLSLLFSVRRLSGTVVQILQLRSSQQKQYGPTKCCLRTRSFATESGCTLLKAHPDSCLPLKTTTESWQRRFQLK